MIWRQASDRSIMRLLIRHHHNPIKHQNHHQFFSSSSHSLSSIINEILNTPEKQYPTHVPLTSLQKGALAALASIGAFQDPRRADLVGVVGETTGVPALKSIRNRMNQSHDGILLLQDKPRITDQSVSHAWDLPPHTFGGAYAKFMGSRGFRANERPQVRFIDDPELAWVSARAREIHDFWHVLFGCHTNVFGETALKALEFVQTGLPMTAMAVIAGEFRLKSKDRAILNRVYLPWAIKAGASAADLMTIYYEKHFDEDLEELRKKWRIIVAPQSHEQNIPKNEKQRL